MLKIRLQRVGRKHEPSFRLVLTDSKNSTKSGRLAETLGSYDPRKTTEAFKSDRIKHWLSQGVGLTGSVNNLLIKKGIIKGKKTHVGTDFVKKETPVVEEVAPAPVAEEPAPVEEPAPESVIMEEAGEAPVVEETPSESPAEPAAE